METAPTTVPEGTQSVTDVTSPQPENAPSTPEIMAGPAYWRNKLRPTLPAQPSHEDRKPVLMFDVLFAGAKMTGRWEDEWPVMNEATFKVALDKSASIEIGGQRPDGSHPRARTGKE